MRRELHIGALIALVLLSFPVFSAIGPVGPTEDVFSKNKKPDDPVSDLPYKVEDHPVLDEDIDVSDNDVDNDIEDVVVDDEDEKEVIDWTTVPYAPYKRIDLSPAPDPVIE